LKQLLLALLAVTSTYAQRTAGDIVKLPSRPPDAKIAYGAAPQQFAELRLPPGKGPFPAVAILHGGCWIGYADASYMAHLATALVDEGFATWNVEYRRAHEPGGGWPGTFDDAERGVAALRDAASKYPIDVTRTVVMGHSAGGQLALYTGSRLKLPAISIAGVVDLRAFATIPQKDCAEGEFLALGGRPEEHPDRYAKVSPAEMLPLGIPQVLIWGEKDSIVPERLFVDYEKRADNVEVVRIPGAGHHDLCAATGPAWEALKAAASRLTKSRMPASKNPPAKR
jgi:acetyl esterase/lipase